MTRQAIRRYRDDPRWITAKYPGVCKTCGGAIQKGEDIFFWPKGRKGQKVGCEDCGEVSSARFEAEAFDEDVLGGFASKSKKKKQSFRRNAGVTADGWVLHFYDEKRNSDKFYAQLVIDDVEIRNWGRVGTDGRISVKYWSDPIEAIEEADKQRASKTRKGYEVLEDREVYVNTATVLRVQEGNATPEDLGPLFENVVFPQPVTARAENMQTKRLKSKDAGLRDYDHWGEDAQHVWWQEEGRHPVDYDDDFDPGWRDDALESLFEMAQNLAEDHARAGYQQLSEREFERVFKEDLRSPMGDLEYSRTPKLLDLAEKLMDELYREYLEYFEYWSRNATKKEGGKMRNPRRKRARTAAPMRRTSRVEVVNFEFTDPVDLEGWVETQDGEFYYFEEAEWHDGLGGYYRVTDENGDVVWERVALKDGAKAERLIDSIESALNGTYRKPESHFN